MKLYKHQEEAVSAAIQHFESGQDKAVWCMAFRTGKTFASAALCQRGNYKSIVFLVPTIELMRQTYDSYRLILKNHTPLFVTSEKYVLEDNKITSIDSAEDLCERLSSTKSAHLIFCTYYSSHLVEQASVLCSHTYDIIIFDEAHRSSGQVGHRYSSLLRDKVSTRFRLFMTATLRANTQDPEKTLSMDDVDKFGPLVYEYTVREAINDGRLTPYKIVFHSQGASFGHENIKGQAERDLRLAAHAAINAIEESGSKKIIAYCKDIDSTESFKDLLESMSEIPIYSMTSKDSYAQRKKLLSSFSKEKTAIMANVYIFREGIDIPDADTVLFTSPKYSSIDIAQMAGRALTKYKGKETAYIVLPAIINENMIEQTSFSSILHILTSMLSVDRSFNLVIDSDQNKEEKENFAAYKDGAELGIEVLNNILTNIKLRIWRFANLYDFLSYKEAQKWVIENLVPKGINTKETFAALGRANLPLNIPTNPNQIYRLQGWTTWAAWFGKPGGNYYSYDEARKWVLNELVPKGVDTQMKYRGIRDDLPKYIPSDPYYTYKKTGHWISWPHWFGMETKDFLAFEKARGWVADYLTPYGVNTKVEYIKADLPYFIPRSPNAVYKEWVSWPHWFGKPNINNKLSYNEAKDWLSSTHPEVKTRKAYIALELPANMTKYPRNYYKNRGWVSWDDFLSNK